LTASFPVPDEVLLEVAAALGGDGPPDPPVEAARLGGGCIHPAVRLRTRAGTEAFLKWSTRVGPSGFAVEARGLEALRDRGGVRVPEVLAFEAGGDDRLGWLLLELIHEGQGGPESARMLGEGLATLHRPEPGWSPGWDENGWIASLPQPNPSLPDWPAFWVEARLLPRWEAVAPAFGPETRRLQERAFSEIHRLLEGWDEDGISLLHGDLWTGNVLLDRDGQPVLIDPAVYRGHREVDLAMMELFGGFPPSALRVYMEAAPLVPEYRERRRDAYQLYPLLVHVELFGGSYVQGVESRLRRLAGD
jgi:protein-ribulosamine 3-kinase